MAAIAPTKASMVPEAVPRGLEPRPGIDALLAALEDVDEVSAVDLRPAVRAAHIVAPRITVPTPAGACSEPLRYAESIREVRKIDPSIRKLSGGDLRLREVTDHLGSLGDLALAGAVGSQFVMSRIEPAREIVLDADPAGYQPEMSPDERLGSAGSRR